MSYAAYKYIRRLKDDAYLVGFTGNRAKWSQNEKEAKRFSVITLGEAIHKLKDIYHSPA
jgi:hypothetical protein